MYVHEETVLKDQNDEDFIKEDINFLLTKRKIILWIILLNTIEAMINWIENKDSDSQTLSQQIFSVLPWICTWSTACVKSSPDWNFKIMWKRRLM